MHLSDVDVASIKGLKTNLAGFEAPDFWQRPERVIASSDPDTATAQTIRIMCQHVRTAAQDELVGQTARSAAGQFSGLGAIDGPGALASAAWWWCKLYIKFVHHENILRSRLGEAGHLQGLISPEVLVRMDRPEGDCAIFSECLCAFLRVFGIPYEFVTVAVNPREPEVYSHVYVYAVLPDGSRLPLDASHGLYPGWQVPSSDVSRRQVWDASGQPVADHGSRFDGLHNYQLRGLGDPCVPGDQDYDPQFCADSSGATSTGDFGPLCPASMIQVGNSCVSAGGTPPYVDSGGAPYSGPVYTAPSQNSAQWAQFAASLAKSGLTLAQINSIQPGTVVSANGAILRQNPGYSVPVGSGIPLSTSLGGNTMLYLGAGLLLLVAVGSMMKGGR